MRGVGGRRMGLISSKMMTPTQLQQCCAEDLAVQTIGYTLQTADGRRAGRIEDILYDDEDGVIRYLVVDTSTAEFIVNQPRVLLPATLCCPDHGRRTVRSRAGAEQVQAAPRYDPAVALTRAYEESVFTNFGEHPYWPT